MAAEIGGHLSHSPKEMWILGFVCHVFTILALGFVGLGVGCLMVGAVSSFEKKIIYSPPFTLRDDIMERLVSVSSTFSFGILRDILFSFGVFWGCVKIMCTNFHVHLLPHPRFLNGFHDVDENYHIMSDQSKTLVLRLFVSTKLKLSQSFEQWPFSLFWKVLIWSIFRSSFQHSFNHFL